MQTFLTVFVAFLAGAVVYLGFVVRDLQRQVPPKLTYAPLPEREAEQRSAEREAHEAMRQRSVDLQAAKLANDWPGHVEHPLADPAGITQAIPVIKPNKHAL